MKPLIILTLISSLLTGSAGSGEAADPATPDARRGELTARLPLELSGGEAKTGLVTLDLGGARPALLYVPDRAAGQRAPLLVMLHGAGGSPGHSIDMLRAHADRLGIIVLAPASRARTWDIISDRRYGRDVRALDKALSQVFASYAVDPEQLAIGGFSDGASYALSLGLTNGELFSHVLAFSPGFAAATRHQGRPRIFVSHGIRDPVLPIGSTSRRLVPQLRRAGFDVDYREFSQGHSVPERLLRESLDAFVG